MNIGVVLGSLPTKGLPLPFISFGGSSLVVDLFADGHPAQHLARARPSRRARRARAAPRLPRIRWTAKKRNRQASPRRRSTRRAIESEPMKVIIAGGGTGGHLFPGHRGRRGADRARRRGALRRHRARHRGARGAEGGLRARADRGRAASRATGCARHACAGLLRVPRAMRRSRARSCGATSPTWSIGVGGYASGPVVLAAALAGRPTAILEQNAVPGFTNRMLGRFVQRGVRRVRGRARASSRARKIGCVGNPVRKPRARGARPRDATARGATALLVRRRLAGRARGQRAGRARR